jgi:predicted oxidoreductase (fatty acid repression mutant protein)
VQIIHLNTNEIDSLTNEIESWKNGFGSVLRADDRELFMEMIEDCDKYADAINAKGEPLRPRRYLLH